MVGDGWSPAERTVLSLLNQDYFKINANFKEDSMNNSEVVSFLFN